MLVPTHAFGAPMRAERHRRFVSAQGVIGFIGTGRYFQLWDKEH